MSEFVVAVESGEETAVDLFHRLVAEDKLADVVELQPGASQPDTLGTWYELAITGLTTSATVGAIATVLSSWLKTRTTKVRLTITSDGGTEIELDQAASMKEITDQVIRILDRRHAGDA